MGRDTDIAGIVTDFSEDLATAKTVSNVLSQIVLQGILTKPKSGESGPEFSLLATGSAGRKRVIP